MNSSITKRTTTKKKVKINKVNIAAESESIFNEDKGQESQLTQIVLR